MDALIAGSELIVRQRQLEEQQRMFILRQQQLQQLQQQQQQAVGLPRPMLPSTPQQPASSAAPTVKAEQAIFDGGWISSQDRQAMVEEASAAIRAKKTKQHQGQQKQQRRPQAREARAAIRVLSSSSGATLSED